MSYYCPKQKNNNKRQYYNLFENMLINLHHNYTEGMKKAMHATILHFLFIQYKCQQPKKYQQLYLVANILRTCHDCYE